MCTVREIEAIQEDCRSQRDMESTEIDRVFSNLTISQERDLFDKPPMPKRPYRRKKKIQTDPTAAHNSFMNYFFILKMKGVINGCFSCRTHWRLHGYEQFSSKDKRLSLKAKRSCRKMLSLCLMTGIIRCQDSAINQKARCNPICCHRSLKQPDTFGADRQLMLL